MAKIKHLKILSFLLVLLITLSCTISFTGLKDESNDIESMKLELTRQALQLTQAAISNSNGQNDNQQSPSSDNQSSSSQDSQQSNGEESDTGEEEEDETPCNDSHIIGETIKDGTVFEPGETFEKTWTLRNEGDCDWNTDYALKFIEGSRMGGASSVSVPSVIEPYEDITFKVNLTAPDNPGDYTGVWQLFADDGEEMGRYWVIITVKDTTPPFAVTSVSTNITNKTFNGACPHTIDVEIYIKTNGAGDVIYQPETSDLGLAPQDTVTFNEAGTDTETYTWTIQNPGNYWLKVDIIDPNNQTFGPFNITVNCP